MAAQEIFFACIWENILFLTNSNVNWKLRFDKQNEFEWSLYWRREVEAWFEQKINPYLQKLPYERGLAIDFNRKHKTMEEGF